MSSTFFAVVKATDPITVLLAGVFVVLTAVAWLVPMTVVDSTGIRTFEGRIRAVDWSEVAGIADRGSGLARWSVRVRLVDGELVGLHSVGVGEVPYLRSMLERSRDVPATPPTAPREPGD